MKVLVATARTQGSRAGDFTYSVDGELVMISQICERDLLDPGRGACGCGRAFFGLNSQRATTTAVVKDVDLSYADYLEALRSSMQRQGWPSEDVTELAEEMLELTTDLSEGTVLGRLGDEVFIREPGDDSRRRGTRERTASGSWRTVPPRS